MHSMDELISRSVKGHATASEERELRTWREAAASNEAYYADMVRMLDAISSLRGPERRQHTPSGAELIRLAGVMGRIDPASPEPRANQRIAAPSIAGSRTTGDAGRHTRHRSSRRWVPAFAAAAAVAALALGGLYYAQQQAVPSFTMGAGEYVSGPNEMTTATLADGTVVRLAPNSRLRIDEAPGRRAVTLHGRAYLAVAHMPDLPFHVRTNAGEVVVLGTRFDVQATEELRVVVVEGKVAVSGARDRVEVVAGEMSMVTNGAVMQPVKVDVRPLVGWVGRFIAFQGTPLGEVARELEREYGARVVLDEASLADLTITGTYVDRSFEEVVVIICGVLGASCAIQDSVATISR